MVTRDPLLETQNEAEAYPAVSVRDIELLAIDHEPKKRLLGLFLMRRSMDGGASPESFFKMARSLIEDDENNCRWQALIVVSEAIPYIPNRVWDIIHEYGDSPDGDMRTAISKILVEHLLDFDFETFFERVQAEIKAGRLRFIDTLEHCCVSNEQHQAQIRRFLRTAKRGRKPSSYAS